MSITNSTATPAQLVMPANLVMPSKQATLVPFAQLEQKKEVDQAIGDSNKAIVLKKAEDDFKGLMPKWMLAIGNTYAAEQKFNSSNGDMGKFLAVMAAQSTLKQCFAKLISSIGSFDGLKAYLDAASKQVGNNSILNEQNDVGSLSRELLNEADNFSTNGDNTQVQQEKSSEFNILAQRASSLGTLGDATQGTIKEAQSQGSSLSSDGSNVGDFLAQISQSVCVC